MSLDRTARGIVLVPCLLLGGGFLSAAAWGPPEAEANRSLALVIGLVLMSGGALAQVIGRGRPPEPGLSGESREP